MKRLLLVSAAAICLATVAAHADSYKVDQAIRTFNKVGYNQYKLNTYCQFSTVAEAQGDRDDDAADAELEPYFDKLGSDFEEAWETADDTDENSYDGKRLNAALDALNDRCPDGADDGDDDGDDDDAADNADDAKDAADTVIDILGDH